MSIVYTKNNYHQKTKGGCCLYCAASFFDDSNYNELAKKEENSGLLTDEENGIISNHHITELMNISLMRDSVYFSIDQVKSCMMLFDLDEYGDYFAAFPCVINSTRSSDYTHRVWIIRYKKDRKIYNLYIDPKLYFFPHIPDCDFDEYFKFRNVKFFGVHGLGFEKDQIQLFSKEDYKHLFKTQKTAY